MTIWSNHGDLSHLWHWLQCWQLRAWINDNLCYLTINCDTGQHSQFLRCFIGTLSNSSNASLNSAFCKRVISVTMASVASLEFQLKTPGQLSQKLWGCLLADAAMLCIGMSRCCPLSFSIQGGIWVADGLLVFWGGRAVGFPEIWVFKSLDEIFAMCNWFCRRIFLQS